jgi:hypothetical protein
VLLGKIGYGTVSECLAHGTPLVFVRRDYFNEEPFLRRLLQMHGAAVEIKRRDFLEGTWAPFLLRAAELDFAYEWVFLAVPPQRVASARGAVLNQRSLSGSQASAQRECA